MNKDDAKKPATRGRPVEHPMPELIPDTPENVAREILSAPPKKRHEWEYLKKKEGRRRTLPEGG